MMILYVCRGLAGRLPWPLIPHLPVAVVAALIIAEGKKESNGPRGPGRANANVDAKCKSRCKLTKFYKGVIPHNYQGDLIWSILTWSVL